MHNPIRGPGPQQQAQAVAVGAQAPAVPVDNAQERYDAQRAEKNRALRDLSGLPQQASILAPQDPFAEIRTCFGQASLTAYLAENQEANSTQIKEREKEWVDAAKERDQFTQNVRPHLTAAGSAVSTDCKKAVAEKAEELSKKAASLNEPGSSVFLSGSYGNKRSTVAGLLSLSQHVLGKNPTALPPLLRTAFEKGKPSPQDIFRTLLEIKATKGDAWQQDPMAKRILSLCPENQRARFISKIEALTPAKLRSTYLHTAFVNTLLLMIAKQGATWQEDPNAKHLLSLIPERERNRFIANLDAAANSDAEGESFSNTLEALFLSLPENISIERLVAGLSLPEHEPPSASGLLPILTYCLAQKGANWKEDPLAKVVLSLLPQEKQETWSARVEKERTQGAESAFLNLYPNFIPESLSHDILLEALVPTDENGVFALIETVLPPAVAAQFKEAATAPKTGEDLLRPFLAGIYEHLYKQVPNGTGDEISAAIEKLLKEWGDSKTIKLASYFQNKDLIAPLVTHWEAIKVAKQEGPAPFFEKIGNLAFELSGSPHAGLASLVRSIVDDSVESTLNELLKAMPIEVRELCQGALLSPTGDLHTKCIYRGLSDSGKKMYDVEIYATGPLLDAAHFKGKWPIQFKNISGEQLSGDFFKCLLQHTLASEERTPFVSSPELAQEVLFTALGKENLVTEGPTLSNTRPNAQEKAFYYAVSKHETGSADRHNPAVRLLTWQHEKLKKLATQHLQNQEDGPAKLVFTTADSAAAMQEAAAQLVAQAENMKEGSAIVKAKLAEIRALAKEIQFAANETWQKVADARFQRPIDAPTPIEVPAWLKATLQPQYLKFKASMDSAGRVLKYLPISKSWKMKVRKEVLEKVFHVQPDQVDTVYAKLEETLGVSPPVAAPRSALVSRISKLFTKATEAVGSLLAKIYEGIRDRLLAAILARPALYHALTQTKEGLVKLHEAIMAKIEPYLLRIRDAVVGAMVSILVKFFVNDTLTRYASAFAKYTLGSMAPDADLDLKIDASTPNGTQAATNIAAGLGALIHFAPLGDIQVTTQDGQITYIKLPGIEEPLQALIAGDAGERRLIHVDSTGKIWAVAKKQNDPKLAAFRPHLILEDGEGNQRVLLREVLVTDKMVENICEKKFGEALWNMIKGFLPQTTQSDALYTCDLTPEGLTSSDPATLLYIMHTHLVRNDETAAYRAYKQFEAAVGEDFTRLPKEFAKRLLPFALCNGQTASQIRLSLFAAAEKQRQNNPAAAGQDSALQAAMWALIAADSMMIDKTDPRFSATEEQTTLLRDAMKTRMQQHLPFYTTGDMQHILAHLLQVDPKDLPAGTNFAVTQGRQYLTNNVDSIVKTLLPGNAPIAMPEIEIDLGEAPAREASRMERAKAGATLMAKAVKEVAAAAGASAARGAKEAFPAYVHQLQEAGRKRLSETDKDLLTRFFTENPPTPAAHNTDPKNLPAELNLQTIKTHFWKYYDVCLNAGLTQDHSADHLKLQIASLQQEIGGDPLAAVLVRTLAELLEPGHRRFTMVHILAGNTTERVIGSFDLIFSNPAGSPSVADIGYGAVGAVASSAWEAMKKAAMKVKVVAGVGLSAIALPSIALDVAGTALSTTLAVATSTPVLAGSAGVLAGATVVVIGPPVANMTLNALEATPEMLAAAQKKATETAIAAKDKVLEKATAATETIVSAASQVAEKASAVKATMDQEVASAKEMLGDIKDQAAATVKTTSTAAKVGLAVGAVAMAMGDVSVLPENKPAAVFPRIDVIGTTADDTNSSYRAAKLLLPPPTAKNTSLAGVPTSSRRARLKGRSGYGNATY